jgi:hypothetical protein
MSVDKFFKACADAGDDIIEFLRGSQLNAFLIILLFFAPVVDLIIWILMICALYRKRAL